jgi:hypothetical protein
VRAIECTPRGVLSILTTYHKHTYPDDGPGWKIHYSAAADRDQFVMVVQYHQGPFVGDLYARRVIDGMAVHFCESAGAIGSWWDIIAGGFDECRIEIIEQMDEQLANGPKPIKKQPQYIHYNQEYPSFDKFKFTGLTDYQKGAA